METKQVIIIRTDTDPKMRKGKMVAQGAHTPNKMLCDGYGGIELDSNGDEEYVIRIPKKTDPYVFAWVTEIFKKIVVKGTKSDLIEAYQQAKKVGIPCTLIEDKGLTEFKGKITLTACAIGPADPDEIDKITGHLELL